MPDFGIFRGFNDKLFGNKLYAGQLPVNLGKIGSESFGFTGLLDNYPNATAAYSLRLLRSSYFGSAIRVRRSSDNTEQDIGFVNNVLDTSSLTTFCGSGNGFVTTWYDQSGNARNATQTTATDQPQIVSSGNVVVRNSLPSLLCSQDKLFTSDAILLNKTYSIFSLFQNTTNDTTLLGNNSPYNYLFYYTSNQLYHSVNSGNTVISASVGIDFKLMSLLRNNSSTINFYKNNNLIGNGTLNNNNDYSPINLLGDNFSATQYNFIGYISEIIIYNLNQSSNRTGIESNINTYYGIY